MTAKCNEIMGKRVNRNIEHNIVVIYVIYTLLLFCFAFQTSATNCHLLENGRAIVWLHSLFIANHRSSYIFRAYKSMAKIMLLSSYVSCYKIMIHKTWQRGQFHVAQLH